MKQDKWNAWIEENEYKLTEAAQQFLRDAQLHAVQKDEITFLLSGTPITFKKLSESAWTMPSSLFVPYGSLSNLFTGFNILFQENAA